jgi:hypothetical protein
MVDFGNPDELRRWLPAQPRELGIALAARSTLGVLPMIGLQSATVGTGPLLRSDTFNIQTCFRCLSTAWIAFGPNLGDRRLPIRVRARSAAAVTPQIGTLFTTPAASAARRSAAEAARFVASTGQSSSESLVNAITAAYLTEPFPDLSKPRPNACASALAGDLEFVANRDASLLSDIPLWLNRPPAWAEPRWRDLKIALTNAQQDWQVWTTWYDDRLDGRIRSAEREVAYVDVANELWARGPDAVNAEIIRRIEMHEPPLRPVAPPSAVTDLRAALNISPNDPPPLDFSKMEDVERWLADKPRDVAVVFAARAALRVIPVLASTFGLHGRELNNVQRGTVLRVFRCAAAAWAVAAFPGRVSELRPAVLAARRNVERQTASLPEKCRCLRGSRRCQRIGVRGSCCVVSKGCRQVCRGDHRRCR